MTDLDSIHWYHLDGSICVAGWHADGPLVGRCAAGGGPVTPCPEPDRELVQALERIEELDELYVIRRRAHNALARAARAFLAEVERSRPGISDHWESARKLVAHLGG